MAFACTGVQAAPPEPVGLPSKAEIQGILHELSDISGFTVHRDLPFESVTREQVNQYVKEQIKQSVRPSEIQAEEVSLKMLGFVPKDFDLKKATIDLLTEQAAAFYDFKRRKLFISDWAAANMRDDALIHELAHALADQNFPLRKYLDPHADSDEIGTAREAVVEGQASWLMLEVQARRAGTSLADPETARRAFEQDDSGDSEYPVFANAPLYLKRTLMFPYEAGQKFQQEVFRHEGKAGFSKVFTDPPVSTAQIDFPERYFAWSVLHKPTAMPELPKPDKSVKEFVSGVLGELETHILLEQYEGKEVADAIAPKLRTGQFRIDEDRRTHRRTLIYVSDWEDEGSAARFEAALEDVIRGKSKLIEITGQNGSGFAGTSEGGFFAVTRAGTKVMSREGYPAAIQ